MEFDFEKLIRDRDITVFIADDIVEFVYYIKWLSTISEMSSLAEYLLFWDCLELMRLKPLVIEIELNFSRSSDSFVGRTYLMI